MLIANRIFTANNGSAFFQSSGGYAAHEWMFGSHKVEVTVFGNDPTEACVDIFIDGQEGDCGDGSGNEYIDHLDCQEFDDLCALILSGAITSSDVEELVIRAVEREMTERSTRVVSANLGS